MKNTSAALTEAIYYILLAMQEPMHGYGIMQKTSTMSNGRLILSAGTLYGAISNLLDKGWILPCGESSDTEVLLAELERLEELVENGRMIIKKKGI